MTATEWIDQAQARCDAATEGPWEIRPMHRFPFPDVLHIPTASEGDALRPDDGKFIAHARTDLPRALAALRAVLDLHTPLKGWDIFGGALPNECPQCDEAPHPCPTVRAIEDALA